LSEVKSVNQMLKQLIRHYISRINRAVESIEENKSSSETPFHTRYYDQLTLIIPSVASRSFFFERLMGYFEDVRIKWPILISDHSQFKDRSILANIAKKFPNLKVLFVYHEPSLHFVERIVDCAERAHTPLVLLHADDDFLFPCSIENSIDFLLHHQDYACCKGRMAFFEVSDHDRIKISAHDGRNREESIIPDRLISHIASFNATLYAVHRRKVFVEAYRTTLQYTENVIFWQYLSSCLTLARGKLKVIDEFYGLRLNNNTGWRSSLISSRDRSHWPYLILSAEFSVLLENFRAGILYILEDQIKEDVKDRLEDAFIWLIRRAMGGPSREPVDPREKFFHDSLVNKGTPENQLLEYCSAIIRTSQISK
jgi:glycosyltransferase domain-containing protein